MTKLMNDYHTVTTIMGHSVDAICNYLTVLEAYDIKNAMQLNEKLGGPKGNDIRVEVVDAQNDKRVLGTIPRPAMSMHHDRVTLAVMGRPQLRPYQDLGPHSIAKVDRVEFRRHRMDIDGWSTKTVLQTAAPLETLMKLPDFRLPGESKLDAERRLYRA